MTTPVPDSRAALAGRLGQPRPAVLAAALALALLAAACAPIPTLPQAQPELPPQALGLPDGGTSAPQSRWWQGYQDAQLDALIERALAQSPSLALARARVAKAEALVGHAEAADRPTFGLGVDAMRQRYPEHGLYPPPIAGSVRTTATVQLGLNYEWDFFGRHEAALQSALGTKRMAEAEAESARQGLATGLARGYMALARNLAQQDLARQQIALREQGLQLIRQRSQAGLDDAQALRQAEAPVPELQRQLLALQDQAALLRRQLAALSGQGPDALKDLQARLPAALAWQGEPTLDLLGRRPDLASARARVEATAQDVRAARALFYPSVNISAFAGFSSIGFDQLFKSGSHQLGVGPALRLPLFDTGRLRAQLRGSAAEQDAAVALYNATLLDAAREAADFYGSLRALQAQQQAQQQLLANAQAQLQLAHSREQAGLANQLLPLQARQQQLLQQRQMLDLQAQSLDTQILLIRALGGGLDAATGPNTDPARRG